MRRIRILLILICSLLPQFVNASDAGGPPKPSDLIGFWKMVEWPNPKLNKINPWPQPYQWFSFYEDGRVVSMMASKDTDYSIEELEKTFSIFTADKSPNYQLVGQFLVIKNPSIKNYQEVWGVNLFARDVGKTIKKGDIVMSLAGGKDGSPVYYRLLRRIK